MYINGFDHPNILAGAGTMGMYENSDCLLASFSFLFTLYAGIFASKQVWKLLNKSLMWKLQLFQLVGEV